MTHSKQVIVIVTAAINYSNINRKWWSFYQSEYQYFMCWKRSYETANVLKSFLCLAIRKVSISLQDNRFVLHFLTSSISSPSMKIENKSSGNLELKMAVYLVTRVRDLSPQWTEWMEADLVMRIQQNLRAWIQYFYSNVFSVYSLKILLYYWTLQSYNKPIKGEKRKSSPPKY